MLSAGDLDRLLAPIALYPDALLGADPALRRRTPGKVGDARTSGCAATQSLKGTRAAGRRHEAGFEPSFVALVAVSRRREHDGGADRLDDALGKAFTADRSAVFASIQRLRGQARTPAS